MDTRLNLAPGKPIKAKIHLKHNKIVASKIVKFALINEPKLMVEMHILKIHNYSFCAISWGNKIHLKFN